MDRSSPPWIPPLDERIESARGTLRDALGALGNLSDLAGSRRVGSKGIDRVLPDVLSSLEPMRDALQKLTENLRTELGDPGLAGELEAFVLPRVAEVAAGLSALSAEPLRTPARLGLDRLLGRISGELDAAQALLELCGVAHLEPKVVLRADEVLRQRLPAPPGGRRPRHKLVARLEATSTPELALKPQCLAALVAVLAERVGESPSIALSPEERAVAIEVHAGGSSRGEAVPFWAYGVIEPTERSVLSAARLAGLELSLEPKRARIRIPF